MEFKKRRRLRQRQKGVILLVKRGKNDRVARAARILNISLLYSSKQQRKMTNFKVLMTTWVSPPLVSRVMFREGREAVRGN